MYAELLETPHYLKRQPDQAPTPLLSNIDLGSVRQELELAEMTDSITYTAAKIETVGAITKEVNRSLWYPEKLAHRDDFQELGVSYPVSLEEIKEKQIANCFGYTCVTSELLDQVGINHWVAYGNGHAFILVPTENEGQEMVYFVDPLLPHLNQYIDNSMRRGSAKSIRGGLSQRERNAFMLDTAQFCRNLGADIDDLPNRHPWLVFQKGDKQSYQDYRDAYFNGSSEDEKNRLQRKFMIIVSAYPSDTGRKMIEEYVGYQQALASTDVNRACDNLRNLSGLYPELDVRYEQTEFRQLINALCETGQTHTALQLVEDYFNGLEQASQDSRVYVNKADCLRSVASSCGSIALANQLFDKAEQEYQRAANHPKSFKQQIMGKIKKVREQREELASL